MSGHTNPLRGLVRAGDSCREPGARFVGYSRSGLPLMTPHTPRQLACATGRVGFSDGDPLLSSGSGWPPMYPFGPSEWRPSLGFAASGLTLGLLPGYPMSDIEWPDSLSSTRQMFIDDCRVSSCPGPGAFLVTRPVRS